jgi:hypothetical protein
MSQVFRAKYIEKLKLRLPELEKQLVKALFQKPWVVYAKRPFGSPQVVLEYLGRYTHKIAISNHRITAIDEHTVSFSYKDYRQSGKKRLMTLEALAFIRRFAQHILPRGLVRIRHYGILSGTGKTKAIPLIRQQLPSSLTPVVVPPRQLTEYNPLLCPCCQTETMVLLQVLPKRGPPKGLRTQQNYTHCETGL